MSSIDTVIRGGKLVDGTGAPWLFSDVALSGDRVVEVAPVGHISPERARDVVDATGMVVCPGFIDIQRSLAKNCGNVNSHAGTCCTCLNANNSGMDMAIGRWS
jgi:N-acyl-D-aspartate/D-glutamate deacylase